MPPSTRIFCPVIYPAPLDAKKLMVAAISAQGIALVNPIFIREELQTKKLIQVIEHTLKMETGFYLVSPRHSSNTENLMKVYNWLVSQFVDNYND